MEAFLYNSQYQNLKCHIQNHKIFFIFQICHYTVWIQHSSIHTGDLVRWKFTLRCLFPVAHLHMINILFLTWMY